MFRLWGNRSGRLVRNLGRIGAGYGLDRRRGRSVRLVGRGGVGCDRDGTFAPLLTLALGFLECLGYSSHFSVAVLAIRWSLYIQLPCHVFMAIKLLVLGDAVDSRTFESQVGCRAGVEQAGSQDKDHDGSDDRLHDQSASAKGGGNDLADALQDRHPERAYYLSGGTERSVQKLSDDDAAGAHAQTKYHRQDKYDRGFRRNRFEDRFGVFEGSEPYSAILLFGGLWGIWGVFFAIPLATVIQAVLRAWPADIHAQPAPPEEA